MSTLGANWFGSFLARRHLSVRSPEATYLGRATAFNKNRSQGVLWQSGCSDGLVIPVRFGFDSDKVLPLRLIFNRHTFPPHMIYNGDETGVFTVQKPQQVSYTWFPREHDVVKKLPQPKRPGGTTRRERLLIFPCNLQGCNVEYDSRLVFWSRWT